MTSNNNSTHRKKISNYMICLDKPLGSGAMGKVYTAYSIVNPEQNYAAKVIQKKPLQNNEYLKEALKRQCLIQRQLKHPNIVSLVDMHETSNNIYIIQQLCSGTNLKQVLKQRKKLDPKEVFYCMKQICMGYSLLVEKGIIHRDLKPQNILIQGENLKIGDFGFAKEIATQNQFLMSIVGSPIYMSPQILRGEKYSSKCDVWSFGIMIFQLLYGHFPWFSKNTGPQTAVAILKKIFTQTLKFPDEPQVDQKIKDFIQECLKLQQKQRLSWLQIFEHEIFESEDQIVNIGKQYRKNAQSAKDLLNNLAEFVRPYQLIGAFLQFQVKSLDFKLFSKIIKQYLIPQATQTQLNIMYEMFDKDCNGVIDLQQWAKSFQVCDEGILKLLNQMVEKGLVYKDMIDQDYFINTGRSYGYDEKIIEQAYCTIKMINYQ